MSETQKNSTGVRKVLIDESYQGQRIDNYLMSQLKGVPRSRVYRMLRRGEVRVNKGRIRSSYRLQPGDIIRIPPVRHADKTAPGRPHPRILRQLEAATLLETPDLLAINKPSGLAVHGGSGVSVGVIEALRWLRSEERALELVHRLDRETSGCLLISKKRSALRTLHELLRSNRVDKRYLALLAGQWDRKFVEVDAPLKKNILTGGERVVTVDPNGKPARTRFRCIERFAGATLVEVELVTGRTHQIRVHAAHLGLPVLGDTRYGDEQANRAMRTRGLKRLFLHAKLLRFQWPGKASAFRAEAPLDAALVGVLNRLRNE